MKRIFKWFLRIFLALGLSIVIGWQVENWRGSRAWEKAQARAAAAGVSLNVADFKKAPVPDDENLLKNEIFLAEWNGEVEPVLQKWGRMGIFDLDEPRLIKGINPTSGRTIDFRDFFEDESDHQSAEQRLDLMTSEIQKRTDQVADLILSYPLRDLGDYELDELGQRKNEESSRTIFGLKSLNEALRYQSFLALRAMKPSLALRNFKAADHLALCFNKPGLIDFLVAQAVLRSSQQIVWEGIRIHVWDRSHLIELSNVLKNIHPDEMLEDVLKVTLPGEVSAFENLSEILDPRMFDEGSMVFFPSGERSDAKMSSKIKHAYTTGGPRGWTLQRKAIAANKVLDLIEGKESWSLLEKTDELTELFSLPKNPGPFYFAESHTWSFPSVVISALKSLSAKRIALIAIAAEQHYLKSGSYPASLDEMQLDFDPTDAVDPKQRPLSYQLDKNGRPEIWSLHEAMNSRRPELRWQFWEKEEPVKSGAKKGARKPRLN